ncbi:ChuX/HutX family heme-like substrate-binding protein [Tistrella mobilis]|uniref:hemin-degrading factor n=1 Tax=Tistrella mobilis TaxID=171437 RepID=UPI0031F6FBC2
MTMPSIDQSADLAARRAALAAAEPGLRVRDQAARLGVSEGELVASGIGGNVILLDAEPGDLIRAVESLGPVMALTRNEHAVHEIVGTYGNVSLGAHAGLVINKPIDLRLFLNRWFASLVVEEARGDTKLSSLQFFDRHGVAMHKIYLRPESDRAAWAALIEAKRAAVQVPPAFEPAPEADGIPAEAPAGFDAGSFLSDWEHLADTHDFLPMLKRHGVSRPAALKLAEGRFARRLSQGAFRAALEAAARDQVKIMIFVPNPGCIQISGGTIQRVEPRGPWINILDPGFNLHVREDHIAAAWQVDKPTVDGTVTAVELYDEAGELFLIMVGVRETGVPELPEWRALVHALPGVTG